MTTTNTPEQLKAIALALAKIHVPTFEYKSCTPKYNAQQNLSGKTHYFDDGTLRWHHCRVLSASHRHGGLLFYATTSDALDSNNTRRGYRAVVHDLFGSVVFRPTLEEASKTRKAAVKACEAASIDLVKHYRDAMKERIRRAQDDVRQSKEALVMLPKA